MAGHPYPYPYPNPNPNPNPNPKPNPNPNPNPNQAVPASRRQENLLQLLLQVLLSHTLGLVWVALILNHAVSGSILSLPYPIACFCYGALESPQPNKIFFSLLLWCVRCKCTPVCSALVLYLPYISLYLPISPSIPL